MLRKCFCQRVASTYHEASPAVALLTWRIHSHHKRLRRPLRLKIRLVLGLRVRQRQVFSGMRLQEGSKQMWDCKGRTQKKKIYSTSEILTSAQRLSLETDEKPFPLTPGSKSSPSSSGQKPAGVKGKQMNVELPFFHALNGLHKQECAQQLKSHEQKGHPPVTLGSER